jgi:hypothetical protein
MRKLSGIQVEMLRLVWDCGGSFIPSETADASRVKVLDDLVKAKRLTVEPTDGGNRYHLTAQGRADAS